MLWSPFSRLSVVLARPDLLWATMSQDTPKTAAPESSEEISPFEKGQRDPSLLRKNKKIQKNQAEPW